jgi:hypothetical protein
MDKDKSLKNDNKPVDPSRIEFTFTTVFNQKITIAIGRNAGDESQPFNIGIFENRHPSAEVAVNIEPGMLVPRCEEFIERAKLVFPEWQKELSEIMDRARAIAHGLV